MYRAGVRFDANTLESFYQYIDPLLLKERLLESLFYLHSQPPLFNLELGLTLKAFPERFALAMHVQFLLWGLLATIALYVLLVQLRVPGWIAVVVTALCSSLPQILIYENWMFYEYPTMALLLLATVALHRFVSSDSTAAGVTFFLLLALVVLMRSMFQIAWLIAVIAALCLVRPRRQVLATAALPFVLVLLLYAKNAILFGTPTTSSWLGMNLARMTVMRLDEADRQRLVANGMLHPVSLVRPFAKDYTSLVPVPAPTGIPVLDRLLKSDGSENFNAKIILTVSRDFLADSLWVIRRYPHIYRGYVLEGAAYFFAAPTALDFVGPNRRAIQAYDEFFSRYVYLHPLGWHEMSPTLVATYLAMCVYSAVLLATVFWRRRASAETITLLFISLTSIYVFLTTSLTDIGENSRMRLVVDPLVGAFVAGAVYQMAGALRGRRPRRRFS